MVAFVNVWWREQKSTQVRLVNLNRTSYTTTQCHSIKTILISAIERSPHEKATGPPWLPCELFSKCLLRENNLIEND